MIAKLWTWRGAVLAGLMVWLFVAAGAVFGQIPKQDFFGTWTMNHDGWIGKLVLRAAGAAGELVGDYVGADGQVRSVKATVESHKIVMTIDLKGTPETSDDQVFDGYLFTRSRSAVAGTTKFLNVVYGWYALKESGQTALPPAPVVTTDHPDPVSAADDPVIVSSSGEIRLSMPKTEWVFGENVVFELKNTRSQPADLTGCYYLIERHQGNEGVEFFTSDKNPFEDLKLSQNEVRTWKWDQRDNERTHKAQPGQWRLKLYAPAIRTKPFVVTFKIVPAGT